MSGSDNNNSEKMVEVPSWSFASAAKLVVKVLGAIGFGAWLTDRLADVTFLKLIVGILVLIGSGIYCLHVSSARTRGKMRRCLAPPERLSLIKGLINSLVPIVAFSSIAIGLLSLLYPVLSIIALNLPEFVETNHEMLAVISPAIILVALVLGTTASTAGFSLLNRTGEKTTSSVLQALYKKRELAELPAYILVIVGFLIITLAASPVLLQTMLSTIRISEATSLIPGGIIASLIYFGGGWLLLHFAGFTDSVSAKHAAHFKC